MNTKRTALKSAILRNSGIFIVILLSALALQSQVPNELNTGYPENSIFHGTETENVQLQNGNLHVNIPIWRAAGRGLNTSFNFVYNNHGYRLVTQCFTGGGGFCQDTVGTDPVSPMVLKGYGPMDYQFGEGYKSISCSGVFTNSLVNVVLREPDGTKHHFSPDPVSAGTPGCDSGPSQSTLYADDGSGWTMQIDATTGAIQYATSKNGLRIYDVTPSGAIPVPLIVDANGNGLTEDPNSHQLSDTLGRSIATDGSYFDSTGIQQIPSVVPDSLGRPSQITLPNGQGTYSFTYAPAVTTQLCQFSSADQCFESSNGGGEIAGITLPTGGQISYTWGIWDEGGREVATRTVTANGVTGTWTYHINNNAPNISAVVTDPFQKDMAYTRLPDPGGSPSFTQTVQYFDGAANASPLIKTVQTDYTGPCNVPSFVCFEVPIRETTTWNQQNLVRKVETDWDSKTVNSNTNPAEVFTWKNPIEVREYDWGINGPGPLLKRTDYSYRHLELDGSFYFNRNLADLPTLTQVYDGSGNLLAQTRNTYDGTAVSGTGSCAAGGVPGHNYCNYDSSNNTRGNLTQSSKWLNTTNTWLNTTNTYNDLGEILTTTDPLLHQTTFDYTDNWGGTGCVTAASTLAFATTITNAKNQRTKTSYYPCTGLPQSKKDENDIATGRAGTTFTYDLLNRPLVTQMLDASGRILAKTSFSYNDTSIPLSITKTVTAVPDPDAVSTVFMDGLGRTLQTQVNDPEGNVTTEIAYDALGRKHTETNPHRSVAAATDGTTQYVYDTLGRTTDVIKPDGNTVHTDYAGSATTVTDETGRQRRTVNDGLGRLVEVDEPGDAYSGAQASGNLMVGGTLRYTSTQAAQAMGSISIAGNEKSVTYPGDKCCAAYSGTRCVDWEFGPSTTVDDSGKVQFYINGQPFSYTYGTGDSVTTIADSIAASIRTNSASTDYTSIVVNTSVIPPVATIYLVARNAGSAGNSITLSYDATIYDTTDFTSASFNPSTSGANLTGGVDGAISGYDSGHAALTVGSFTGASVPYSSTQNSNAADLAAALAAAFTNSPGAPARAEILTPGSTSIHITYLSVGQAGNVIASVASAPDNAATYPGGSFSGTTNLANGQDAYPSALAHPYTTLYAYDGLGNLTCVEQHGDLSGTGCASPPSSDSTSPWRVRRFTYDSLSRLLTAKNPETGQTPTTYQYDNDSNLILKTDARGVTINYSPSSSPIDALHRVTQKTYSDGTPTVTYQYDTGCCGVTPTNAVGRITAAFAGNTELVFSYDPLGDLQTQWDCPPSGIARGFCYVMSANYDATGNVVSLTYPDGKNVATSYNAAGRMNSVKSGTFSYYAVPQSTSPTTWGYWPTGAMNRGTYGNGVVETTAYNNRLQVSAISDALNGTAFFSKSFGYYDGAGHDNGDILSITDAAAATKNQTFTYDSLNRIKTGTQADNSFNLNFNYDAWGNMTESGTSNFPPAGFDVTNRVHQSSSCTPNLVSFCYDGSGDMLMDNHNHAFTYDGEARIKTVDGTAAAYTYNALGNRVRKDAGGTSTEYFFFNGNVIAELNPATGAYTDYIFGYGKRIAKDTSNNGSAAQYYHDDQIGSARVMTDAGGTKISDCTFNPFGEQVLCSPDNASNHYRFSGKEHDSESQLDDFGARYYGSSMGRWLTPDWSVKIEPVPYAKLDNPQSLNLDTYVLNNPMSNVDTDGHACSGVLGNTGSGFCTRATEYGKIDADASIGSKTRFFAAANAVSQALADVAAWGGIGGRMDGVSAQTASFLEGVGQKLQPINEAETHMIAGGKLSGPSLDQQLVHTEQTVVQGQLDALKQADPAAYSKTISEINGALNPSSSFDKTAASAFATDKAFQGVLDGVRKDLGRNIDFSKQSDREAIGNALIKHVRQTGGCDINGKKQPGC